MGLTLEAQKPSTSNGNPQDLAQAAASFVQFLSKYGVDRAKRARHLLECGKLAAANGRSKESLRFTALRTALGLTQKEVAAICQVSQSSVNGWGARRRPNKLAIPMLAILGAIYGRRRIKWCAWGLSPNGTPLGLGPVKKPKRKRKRSRKRESGQETAKKIES